ncbi:hypothetical protein EB796_017428 [Bugula neritina]|nr:hypothetical protein EB796_017428 [Bugula neritina]
MPLNDYKRGSMSLAALETNCRRGSIPVNQLRMYETSHGWQFNEDDERKTSAEFYKTVRGSPEGCDSEPEESNSRRPSKKEPEINNNKNSAV